MLSLAWVSACKASKESLVSTSFGKLAEEQSRGTRGTMASRQTGNTGMVMHPTWMGCALIRPGSSDSLRCPPVTGGGQRGDGASLVPFPFPGDELEPGTFPK